MKKLFSLLAMAMLVLSVLPSFFAVSVGKIRNVLSEIDAVSNTKKQPKRLT